MPLHGDLSQLKRWHHVDPPSAEEIERNNLIREIQGNDNQFIVNPEAADSIKLIH
ncbi:endonuclease [Hahella ganghwensis]|uniref:endonuclease n=1 Tax=Hahella ganghwensis TaxID=286420 RepID=UPI003CCBC14F